MEISIFKQISRSGIDSSSICHTLKLEYRIVAHYLNRLLLGNHISEKTIDEIKSYYISTKNRRYWLMV